MRRKALGFIVALALGLLAAPLAPAQSTGKVPRIGLLLGWSPSVGSPSLERIEAFRQGLRELGYVEGKNLAIEYRWAEEKPERFPDLAAELVRLKVDVIVAHSTAAAQAAKNATGTLPIVMVIVADPIRAGLVSSLARPSGNVTGLSYLATDLAAKQLELLKEAVPKLSRVAALWNPINPAHALILRRIETAAPPLGVTLQMRGVRGPEELEGAFATMSRERAGGLLVLPDPIVLQHRTRIAALAATHRLPAMYNYVDDPDAGGLMAYAPDDRDNFRRAAAYVDKLLKGAKPADLPVEQPTRVHLVINLKTAKVLGLTIPPSLMIRADKVIQ